MTIVGGGVAGLEALLALRALTAGAADARAHGGQPEFAYRPLAVAEPFGAGVAHRFDLTRIARDKAQGCTWPGMAAVSPSNGASSPGTGATSGTTSCSWRSERAPVTAVPGSVSIKGPAYTSRFRTVLRDLDRHRIKRWPSPSRPDPPGRCPLYELALMTAAHVAERGLRKVSLQLVTHESEPLELFGPPASAAVRDLLEERGVELDHESRAARVARRRARDRAGAAAPADRVVSLPRLTGPAIAGLPADADGFIPVDLHGRVSGLEDVYAAGDATNSPIKQGGVAAQQADAAAEAIAAQLGLVEDPKPFRPVLRGLLLTGGTPRYLRSEMAGGRGDDLRGVRQRALVAAQQGRGPLSGAVSRRARRANWRRPPEGMGVDVPIGDRPRRSQA